MKKIMTLSLMLTLAQTSNISAASTSPNGGQNPAAPIFLNPTQQNFSNGPIASPPGLSTQGMPPASLNGSQNTAGPLHKEEHQL